jgi:uncharacterized SAM-binding protein YcdF (DUF218 family)
MFIISKLFTYLFLPPGIFIFILLLASIYAKKFKKLFLVSALILYLISIKPISNMLLLPLESFSHKDNITPNAVVVLGGGVNPIDKLHASADAFKREVYGILIAKENSVPLIFTGGGIDNEAKYVKKDIKLITSTCNCDLKTYFESSSKDTYENAKYTSELFKKLKLKKEIFLVTSAYHMKRAYKLFKHFGFKIITKPVGFLKKPINSTWDFFPSANSFYKSYKAIHEYFGILSLKLRGI